MILSINKIIKPDFIELYSEREKYNLTENTAVGWYQYDNVVDNTEGLWDAIYHNDKRRLKAFKERFNVNL